MGSNQFEIWDGLEFRSAEEKIETNPSSNSLVQQPKLSILGFSGPRVKVKHKHAQIPLNVRWIGPKRDASEVDVFCCRKVTCFFVNLASGRGYWRLADFDFTSNKVPATDKRGLTALYHEQLVVLIETSNQRVRDVSGATDCLGGPRSLVVFVLDRCVAHETAPRSMQEIFGFQGPLSFDSQ